MTTRRSFIQGVLAAIGAAVMPKAAAAMPENDSGGYVVPPDIADGISDRLKTVATSTPTVIRGTDVTVEIDGIAIDRLTLTGPVPQKTIDEYMGQGVTVTVSPPTSRPDTFTSPFESPLATPEVPDEH